MSKAPRLTQEQLDAIKGKRKDNWPLVVRRNGAWHWTRRPADEDDVERACLTIADWHLWCSLADLAPRGKQVLSKVEHERAVRIALAEVEALGLRGVYYRTSTKARSRNQLGTPDYHFVRIGGPAIGVEFKGPSTAIRVNQAVLAALGGSVIVGPDDLALFVKTIGGE